MSTPSPFEGAYTSPVTPGTGWPGDPATKETPVATTAEAVERAARRTDHLADLDAQVSVCRACKRLVKCREDVARDKRRAFAIEPYWGRPIPGWGDPTPRLLIMGLAPAAHGGNRTGRVFTGDRSGDWLFAALHRVGLASQPTSIRAGDGLSLRNTRIVAAVRCAPPDNKPTIVERDTCAPWLNKELAMLLPTVRAVVALGGYGWDATLRAAQAAGCSVPSPKPKFGHGATTQVTTRDGQTVHLIGTFHPSQQNTFTGRLTEPMLDDVLARGKELSGA